MPQPPPAAAQPAATPQPQPTAVPAERSFDAAAPILIEDDGETRTVSVQAFLIGTAASEMPPDWPEDAILAQMVAAHSYDADNRPLSTYSYQDIRFLKIFGVWHP